MTKSKDVVSLATARLAEVSGVVVVVLGGSVARGSADRHSDLDLGIYYDPSHPPALADLRRVAAGLDDRGKNAQVTDFGEWGPWINGGAWLVAGGLKMDWLFRDLDRVEVVIADCRAGRLTTDYQPGHPHGFHSYIYMGEIHHGPAPPGFLPLPTFNVDHIRVQRP